MLHVKQHRDGCEREARSPARERRQARRALREDYGWAWAGRM